MPNYRAYSIGEDGRFNGSRAFFCHNDAHAMEWAKQMFSGQPVELHNGDSVVGRFDPATASSKVGASHEIREGKMVRKDG
jgi:hypothetical protein